MIQLRWIPSLFGHLDPDPLFQIADPVSGPDPYQHFTKDLQKFQDIFLYFTKFSDLLRYLIDNTINIFFSRYENVQVRRSGFGRVRNSGIRIRRSGSGTNCMTLLNIRHFFRKDSRVTDRITYDLMMAIHQIQRGERKDPALFVRAEKLSKTADISSSD
jgi:hypothetical protein